MSLKELLQTRRADVLRVAAKHGAANVRVFGSVVRDEANAESDVDLLVEAEQNHTPFFPGGLIADLESLLGVKVDVVEPAGLHWYIRDRVLKEAVPL